MEAYSSSSTSSTKFNPTIRRQCPCKILGHVTPKSPSALPQRSAFLIGPPRSRSLAFLRVATSTPHYSRTVSPSLPLSSLMTWCHAGGAAAAGPGSRRAPPRRQRLRRAPRPCTRLAFLLLPLSVVAQREALQRRRHGRRRRRYLPLGPLAPKI
jgi:hypothetical protein